MDEGAGDEREIIKKGLVEGVLMNGVVAGAAVVSLKVVGGQHLFSCSPHNSSHPSSSLIISITALHSLPKLKRELKLM